MLVELSPEEIELLCSALESAEYWEHKDVLTPDSGYIMDPTPEELEFEDVAEAWEEVQAMRALAERLAELQKGNYDEYPDDTTRKNGPIVTGEPCPWCGALVTGDPVEHTRSHD